MKILTAADMAATDRVTAEDHAIPIAILMENAGAAVAAFIARQHPAAKRILVLCGKGNNGGDGLVAARYLSASKEITVALLAEESAFQNEAAAALKALKTTPATLKTILDEPSLTAFDLTPYDLIVDAVLGTGFKPPLRPLAAALRTRLTDEIAGKKNIVAIDIPTGWDADSRAQTSPDAFPADAVVTFTAPKLAHVFGHLTPNTSFGPIVIANIGSPEEAIVSSTHLHWTGSSKPIAEKPRDINANKGKFGHVLLIGGSYGTAGAPSMSALAALRTGAGLVTAAVPDSILPLVARIAPELMLAPRRRNHPPPGPRRRRPQRLRWPRRPSHRRNKHWRKSHPRPHPAPRRDGPPHRPHHQGGRSRPRQHRQPLRRHPQAHPGPQRLAHPHRPSRRPHRRQHLRQPRHGQGRQR